MGFVHHSVYLVYLETARTEFLRQSGETYRQWEEQGILLPLTEASIQFKRPGRYDDLLRIETRMVEQSALRLKFSYRVILEGSEDLLATGETRHAFINKEGRPIRIGPHLQERLKGLVSGEK